MQITVITQISAALGDLICAAALTMVFSAAPKISVAFLEKKFPYALRNLTFTNKFLVKGQKKNASHKKVFILHYFLLKKFTAKTVDEDPVGCQRWISRKEILTVKILRTKNEKSTWRGTPGS